MMVLLLFLLLSLTSCPAESFEIANISPSPFTVPVLEEAVLIENSRITLSFDRPIRIRQMHMEEKKVEITSEEKRIFSFRLPEEIPYGEKRRLRFTAEDSLRGNLSRITIPLIGINRDQAEAIMTEISVKGTDSSPDRIELQILKKGTTGALTITDGGLTIHDFSFTLPDLKVNSGDTIVLHLSRPHKGDDEIRIGNRRIFHIDIDKPHSLLSTNGAVLLYSHTNGTGKIMDAFLYNRSDSIASDGYGNEKTRLTAEELERRGHWHGKGFPSDSNTSTRVFARYYPYGDRNDRSDWYLTDTRGTTFGSLNDNNEYIVPEESEKE